MQHLPLTVSSRPREPIPKVVKKLSRHGQGLGRQKSGLAKATSDAVGALAKYL
jgi:hypothetical protein